MKTRKIKERNDSSWRRKKIANSPPQNPSSIILSQGENGQIREIKHIFQINLANLPTWNNNWYSGNMIFSPSKKSKTKHQEKKNISIDIFYSVLIVLIFVQQQSIVEGACGILASSAIYKRWLLPQLYDSSINGSAAQIEKSRFSQIFGQNADFSKKFQGYSLKARGQHFWILAISVLI